MGLETYQPVDPAVEQWHVRIVREGAVKALTAHEVLDDLRSRVAEGLFSTEQAIRAVGIFGLRLSSIAL